MARGKVQYNGWTVYTGVNWDYDKETITVKMSPGGWDAKKRGYSWKKLYKKTWKNYCPKCKKPGILKPGGKGKGKTALEGEITCTKCDNDFDGVTGYKKINGSKLHLTAGSSTSKTAIKNKQEALKELKEEYNQSKSAKRSMTLKIPPLKGIKDGHCHQLSPPLVDKDLIVYVESVEITEKEVVMTLNDKLEPSGEEYKPPAEKTSASNYKATTKAEKEIIAQGEKLKKSTDLNTVKSCHNWLKSRTGKGGFNYTFYENWPGGDIKQLNKTALAKRWNMKKGNCVFFAYCLWLMCKGAGVDIEIWHAVAGGGFKWGHLYNRYKGSVYDCTSYKNHKKSAKLK